ncbi:MAG: hypothetical protein ACW98X_11105 [Promethearchaeota archaeon]|jgi:hypothetical protein
MDNIEIKCEYCNKKLKSEKQLKKHFTRCKIKPYKDEIEMLTELNSKKDSIIEATKDELHDCKLKLEFCSGFLDKMSINYSNSVYRNNDFVYLDILDSNAKLREIIYLKFDTTYFLDGQIGVSKFVYDNIISNSYGKYGYKCSDSARKIFKYIDKNNKTIKDPYAIKLTNKLLLNGLGDRAYELSKSLVKTNGYNTISAIVFSIKDMASDNVVFCKNLAGLLK